MNKAFKRTLKKNPVIYRYASLIKQYHHMHFLDEMNYTKKKFRKEVGRDIDLENPRSYNDKLHWLKFNWRNDLATTCSDKYFVRDYVISKGLGDILNEIHGVFDNVDEINIDELPEKFVLKANHGSGWLSICADRNNYNWKREKYKLDTWMKLNFYYKNQEWVYKDIKPKIICEKYLGTEDGSLPKDYKIYCFNGIPKFIDVCHEREKGLKVDLYDLGWIKQSVDKGNGMSDRILPRPVNYEYMLEIARTLSAPFPHSRIDLYEVSGKVFFGEITLSPGNGSYVFTPEKYDYIFGDMLKLPELQK